MTVPPVVIVLLVFGVGVLVGGFIVFMHRRQRRQHLEQVFRSELDALRAVQRLHLAAWRSQILMDDAARRFDAAG